VTCPETAWARPGENDEPATATAAPVATVKKPRRDSSIIKLLSGTVACAGRVGSPNAGGDVGS
jgi:hypothetical protein